MADGRKARTIAALQKELDSLTEGKKQYKMTSFKRGEASPLFEEWSRKPTMVVLPKLKAKREPSLVELHVRIAALARWRKGAAGSEPPPRVASGVGLSKEARQLVEGDASRTWRRGESAMYVSTLRDYSPEVLAPHCLVCFCSSCVF